MKNTIPLVMATILGLLAVFAVSRAMSQKSGDWRGKEVNVLVANSNLKAGETIAAENFRTQSVPLAYLPKQHILEDQKELIAGQTLAQDIAAGDYILWNNIGRSSSLGDSVGEGEWAVPVKFANQELVRLLKPGDEIAIIGVFNVSEERDSGSSDANAPKIVVNKEVTAVLFSQVRIMSMDGRGSSVLLSLPPAQALTIIAAQNESNGLYAALRRPHDEKSTNRKDTGVFERQAFARMLDGCRDIPVPDQPFNKTK